MAMLRLASLALCVALGVLIPFDALTRSKGAPAARTGAPGNETCATSGCHDGNQANTGSGTLSVTMPAQFMPGDTVQFTIEVSQDNAGVFGFQATVRRDNGLNVIGDFLPRSGQKFSDALGDYITHSDAVKAGGAASWTLDWVAPASDVEDVIIYVGAVAGNDNGNRLGDHVYTTSATLPIRVDTDREVAQHPFTLHAAYPNPTRTQTTISYETRWPEPVRLALYDALGRVVRQLPTQTQPAGIHEVRVNTHDLPAGVYFYEIQTPTRSAIRSLTILP